jgi:hypothetical protein
MTLLPKAPVHIVLHKETLENILTMKARMKRGMNVGLICFTGGEADIHVNYMHHEAFGRS